MALDTASTRNKTARIISNIPTTNFGGSFTAGNFGGSTRNGLVEFTMSSGSGSISRVSVFLYSTGEIRSPGGTHSIHEITTTGWTQAGVTWNKYDGTNNWTTAGGDYGTAIYTSGTISGTPGWVQYDIMGGSAVNPLTLNWGDSVNVLLKVATGTSEVDYDIVTNLPYVEIEYTVGGATYRRKALLGVGQ